MAHFCLFFSFLETRKGGHGNSEHELHQAHASAFLSLEQT